MIDLEVTSTKKTGDQVWTSSMIGPLTEREDRVFRTVSHSSTR